MELTILLFFASLVSIVHSDYKVCVSLNQEAISSESVPCSKNLSNLNEVTQLELNSAVNTVILVNSTVLSKMLTLELKVIIIILIQSRFSGDSELQAAVAIT